MESARPEGVEKGSSRSLNHLHVLNLIERPAPQRPLLPGSSGDRGDRSDDCAVFVAAFRDIVETIDRRTQDLRIRRISSARHSSHQIATLDVSIGNERT